MWDAISPIMMSLSCNLRYPDSPTWRRLLYRAFRLPFMSVSTSFNTIDGIVPHWNVKTKTHIPAPSWQEVRTEPGLILHGDVIRWKHFPRYWPFVRGIHRSPVNSSHKGQWRGALMFSLIYVWINGCVNNREAGDLRRYRGHYEVTVMTEADSRFAHSLWEMALLCNAVSHWLDASLESALRIYHSTGVRLTNT